MKGRLCVMDEQELIKLLDKDSLRKFEGIKKMLSSCGLKLKIVPSDYEDEPNVFYFRITDDEDKVSIFYDKEFGVDDDELYDDLSTEFAVAFHDLFDATELMVFVTKALGVVSNEKCINFTNVAVPSEISNQICITASIDDEYYNKIGDCSFTVDSETQGVDMRLYIDNLEVITRALCLSDIQTDINVRITPTREITHSGDWIPSNFEFDVEIKVQKHFSGLGSEYVRKARRIIKNFANVYNMIKED